MRRSKEAFTIVELAVIMTTMGILVLIGTFCFGSWRSYTADKEVKSGINQLQATMDNARNFADVYPATFPDDFTNDNETNVATTTKGTAEFTIITTSDGASYCGRVRSTKIPSIVYYVHPPGVTTMTTSVPGGCTFS